MSGVENKDPKSDYFKKDIERVAIVKFDQAEVGQKYWQYCPYWGVWMLMEKMSNDTDYNYFEQSKYFSKHLQHLTIYLDKEQFEQYMISKEKS